MGSQNHYLLKLLFVELESFHQKRRWILEDKNFKWMPSPSRCEITGPKKRRHCIPRNLKPDFCWWPPAFQINHPCYSDFFHWCRFLRSWELRNFFTHAVVQTKDCEIRKLTWDASPLPTIHVQISFMLGVNTICQKKILFLRNTLLTPMT